MGALCSLGLCIYPCSGAPTSARGVCACSAEAAVRGIASSLLASSHGRGIVGSRASVSSTRTERFPFVGSLVRSRRLLRVLDLDVVPAVAALLDTESNLLGGVGECSDVSSDESGRPLLTSTTVPKRR